MTKDQAIDTLVRVQTAISAVDAAHLLHEDDNDQTDIFRRLANIAAELQRLREECERVIRGAAPVPDP